MVGIGTADNKILVVSGSMEDSATPAKIIQATVEKFHRIDVLVNNAGAGTKPGCKDPSSVELLDFLYAVNYRRFQKTLKIL